MGSPYDAIRGLIKEGECLELRDQESYQKLLRWIERANQVLNSFTPESD